QQGQGREPGGEAASFLHHIRDARKELLRRLLPRRRVDREELVEQYFSSAVWAVSTYASYLEQPIGQALQSATRAVARARQTASPRLEQADREGVGVHVQVRGTVTVDVYVNVAPGTVGKVVRELQLPLLLSPPDLGIDRSRPNPEGQLSFGDQNVL